MNKLTKKQVCEALGMSLRQLDYMVKRGEFPRGVSHGKTHLWAAPVVERFEKERFAEQLSWFDTRLAR